MKLAPFPPFLFCLDESTIIISDDRLKEVVTTLQASASLPATPFQPVDDEEINDSLQEMSLDEHNIDIRQHFHVIDAFDLPQYKFDEHRKNFYL